MSHDSDQQPPGGFGLLPGVLIGAVVFFGLAAYLGPTNEHTDGDATTAVSAAATGDPGFPWEIVVALFGLLALTYSVAQHRARQRNATPIWTEDML